MTRVAVIDLGTNSTRLLVADVADGRVDAVVRRLRITRLGEGVDSRRRLLPLPIARVRNCLSDFRRELETLGAERTLAFGTSAIRDAENGKAFLGEIEWSYGFATRMLSGEDEALLTFRGVGTGRQLTGPTLVVDVGGGSTELILGTDAGVRFHASLDLGCVRMTERFLASDPPTPAELALCREATRSALAEHVPDGVTQSGLSVIGVAGTVTSLAALDLRLADYDPARIHRHVLGFDSVARHFDRLGALPLAERAALPGLDPARAPVIVAGAAILSEILAFLGADAIEASEHDILQGAALEAAALPALAEGDAPPGAYSCC